MTERSGSTIVEWAAAGAPHTNETESGDLHVVAPFPGGVLVAAIDGLGHGAEAAHAARTAAAILDAHAAEAPLRLIERCHEELRKTRGAVMTLASFDALRSEMTWIGIGNVEAVLLRADVNARAEAVLLRGGIVGFRLPVPRETSHSVERGDTLILTTDGILPGFTIGIDLSGTPVEVAETILARYGKGSDDALVVVARYVGSAP